MEGPHATALTTAPRPAWPLTVVSEEDGADHQNHNVNNDTSIHARLLVTAPVSKLSALALRVFGAIGP